MPKMGNLESRFADLIWAHEPLPSGQLVKMAAEALHWKSSTSYTVLKRLCARGIFQNQNGTVTSLLSRDDFYAMQYKKDGQIYSIDNLDMVMLKLGICF